MATFAIVSALFAPVGKAKAEEEFDLFGMAASTGVFFMNRGTLDDVEAVQEIFYNHGYNIVVDGNYGPKTEESIRKLQSNIGQSVTGILTYDQWLSLKAESLPKSWGALSASIDGKFGEAHNKSSRALAEQIALRRCERYTKRGCIVISIHDNGWSIAKWCKRKNTTWIFMGASTVNYQTAHEELLRQVAGIDPRITFGGKCFKQIEHNAKAGFLENIEAWQLGGVEYPD